MRITDIYALNIFVRQYRGAHIARCSGLKAQSSHSVIAAAQAVAEKLAQARCLKLLLVTRLSDAQFLAEFTPPTAN
jgi:hypothetical protein